MATVEAPPRVPPAEPVKKLRSFEDQGRLASGLMSPTFLVLLVVIGYPIVAGIRQSLFSTSQAVDESGFVVEGEQFVGLDNYTAVFSGETGDRFWNAFYNTTFFTVVCVAIEVVIGVAMALIMNKAFRGKGLIRASILVPWAIPTVVSALLWRWIFDANGIANADHQPADPVVHRRLAGQGSGHHRRHLEDGAVHRPARPRRAAGHPRRGLRGGKD